METLKENVEDLSDDKIFEEMIKIVQEKSMKKFSRMNHETEEAEIEQVMMNEEELRHYSLEKSVEVLAENEESTDVIKSCSMPTGNDNEDVNDIEVSATKTCGIVITKRYLGLLKNQQRCPYCPYKANHAHLLLTHVHQLHTSFVCFPCPLCPAPSFSHPQLSSLKAHMDRKHLDRRFQCPECRRKFTTLWNCEGHIGVRHTENFEKIRKILRGREGISKDPREITRNISSNVKRCPYCDFMDDKSGIVRKHIVVTHEERLIYKCPKCRLKDKSLQLMRKHIRISKHYVDTV